MLSRKASVWVTASNPALLSSVIGVGSTTSSFRGTRHQQCSSKRCRKYATIADNPTRDDHGQRSTVCEHVWPKAASGHTCPTPYQIFGLKQGQQYSKIRFYELVKIYHPDRNSEEYSHSIRVERYRLIVAAHTILSDPVKRSAYDRFGSGWEGKAEVQGIDQETTGTPGTRPGPFSHSWNQSNDDPIWQNATWEDWERWHDRQAGNAPREPVFMKNGYFVVCVSVLAAIGITWNYGRAQDASTFLVEQRDLVHDRAAKDLRRVRQEKARMDSRQDRIEFFLRQREATIGTGAFGVDAIREERASRLLPDKEICRSDEVRDKD